ncbi:MAG: metallophosphoesterase family protein [Desulforhabdus sp.]|nr:metallophosphoesterase family protein [Desulforhabdus sp.]
MRRVAHLSDLHFNTIDLHVAEGLLSDLEDLQPDLVVVSGDLTQRARRRQFQAARNYLQRIPFPQLVVPGNHDIPLFDIVRRFLAPLERYKKYITPDLSPEYIDEEIAFFGINTTRPLSWKNGGISVDQIHHLQRRLCAFPDRLLKAVVAHHPFTPPIASPSTPLVKRAAGALSALEGCGIELLLAGHLHVSYSGNVHTHYVTIQHNILAIQSGTAISTRRRSQPNAYSFLTIDGSDLTLSVRTWQASHFQESARSQLKTGGLWRAYTTK